MIAVRRAYLTEGDRNGVWDEVSNLPKDPYLRRVALIALVANGCPRSHWSATLGVSEPTLNRDIRALKQAHPDFGSDAWRLDYLERQANDLRHRIHRDDADEAMSN